VKRVAAVVVAAGALALPALVLTATQRLVDRLGRDLGANAAAYTGWLKPSSPSPLRPLEPVQFDVFSTETLTETAKSAKAPRSKRGARAVTTSVRGIRISARQVIALAQRGAMPNAVAVAASKTHPAGLRLVGVSGLGVGMRDGDVLTRVAGTPIASVSRVASLVMSARNRFAREISAEFWRDGARWMLVVEQPYLGGSAPPSAPVAQGSRTP
jgi:hypothetical protein